MLNSLASANTHTIVDVTIGILPFFVVDFFHVDNYDIWQKRKERKNINTITSDLFWPKNSE